MKQLQFESNKQQYNIAGKVTVEFCPTDMDFIERIVDVFRDAEKDGKALEENMKGAGTEKVFEIARQRDTEMREAVNGLFGVDVFTPLVGSMNVWARSNGFPIWANLLTAILDECYDNLPEEDKAAKARIDKYTKKYQKKR